MVLNEIAFGVQNSVLEKDELGAFVHEIEISVRPSSSWLSDCDFIKGVHPSPEPQMVQKQVGSSCTVGIQAAANPTGVISYQSNKSSLENCLPYGWLPAATSWKEKSVTWRWKMNTWKDSTRFKLNRPSSFASGKGFGDLRKLPFTGPELSYNDQSFVADATWKIPTCPTQERSIEMVVEVKLHTAQVKKISPVEYLKYLQICKVKPGEFSFGSEVECNLNRVSPEKITPKKKKKKEKRTRKNLSG